jgi:hypothetical protein
MPLLLSFGSSSVPIRPFIFLISDGISVLVEKSQSKVANIEKPVCKFHFSLSLALSNKKIPHEKDPDSVSYRIDHTLIIGAGKES